MQNLNQISKTYIERIFDLKGSTADRITKNIEKVDKYLPLKDNDFLWMKQVYQNVFLIIFYFLIINILVYRISIIPPRFN